MSNHPLSCAQLCCAMVAAVSLPGSFAAPAAALEPVLVRNLDFGSGDSSPCDFVDLGGFQVFAAADSRGRELWRTDGTYLGTQRIKDIWPSGSSSSGPHNFFVFTSGIFGQIALFVANDGSTGNELWRTDGTLAGTQRVVDLRAGGATSHSNPSNFVFVPEDGRVYFKAFNGTAVHLYRTDGLNTTLVSSLSISGNRVVAHLPGYIFLAAINPANDHHELFRIDLSDNSAQVVATLNASEGSYPSELTTIGSLLYLEAYTPATGREPYVTDGSIGNLVALGDLKPGPQSSFSSSFTSFAGAVYFANGVGLVKTQGTAATTSVVTTGLSAAGPLIDTGSLLYFSHFVVGLGAEPHVTDGTNVGLVEDVQPGAGSSFSTWQAASIGGTLVFQADDGVHGIEAWQSTDGTAPNTDLLADLEPGGASSGAECFRDFASYGLMGAEQTPFGKELFALVDTAEDFGDAPDSYGTALTGDGPRHALGSGLYLGATVDAELDRPYDLGALADDGEGFDDEDGIAFGTGSAFLGIGDAVTVEVTASGTGTLDAWVDFNRDGDFTDPGEKVSFSGGGSVSAGVNAMTFTVPASALPGTSYARFRLSSAGVADPIGAAPDGEVEDYLVVLAEPDFGDAPDPGYPTLRSSDGARHGLVPGPILGTSIDAEADGNPSSGATGDDIDGSDDEDGVTLSALVPGQMAVLLVEVTDWSGPEKGGGAPGVLNAWIDFNRDGDWDDAGEQVAQDHGMGFGNNVLEVAVPADASLGTTVARFRLSTTSGLSPFGSAPDGEVEDHAALITAVQADLQITKTDGQSAAVPGGQVTYTIVASNPSGPNDAFGVRVADLFPSEIVSCSIGCTAAGGASCPVGGGIAPGKLGEGPEIDELVDLPVGGSVTFVATCDIDASASGTLTNTATVSVPATMGDPNLGNNSATDADDLIPEGDLAISKTDGVSAVVHPAVLVYTIVVENPGPSDAFGAQVLDAFPPELANVEWLCVGAGGGSCADDGLGDIDESVDIPAGGSVTFTAIADTAGDPGDVATNTATVSPPGGFSDPAAANNSATDVTVYAIFLDGFESGDFSAWNAVVGGVGPGGDSE